ncbi:hypothetical protein, conserved [Eimeria tenella]|uniref:NAC-A/B domain-containing protein n=1 Tax=Eimeria tenella TaxID=5802 RepID=U6KRJ4_EIMTE|nr:hypothetical protein, conserved [Eimeria tenella]CDJ38058.1 hypothetical protein, conserved [Eimeria tenella]|eukprot:XP_013228896.1 hypothetical protein, conserved [Eimeria tenella]
MANKKAEEPEHISSSSSDSGSEDEQKGEGAQQEQKEGEGSPSRSRQSRNERKARKAILRLGMKPMPDIVKVVIRKAKQQQQQQQQQNKYIGLTRELLAKYPDVRFQDCFVAGNEPTKGSDTFRADHPAMQFVAQQLRFMNEGMSKREAFKKAEEVFRQRRASLERTQKMYMAAAVAAAAAKDPAAAPAAAAAAMPTSAEPLTAAEGMGPVQPMFTSGKSYWQV